MDHVSNRADLDQLREEVFRIESEPGFDFAGAEAAHAARAVPAPQPEALPIVAAEPVADAPERQPFGAWLVAQKKRSGWIADLAKWAASDFRAQAAVTPDDVRKRLTEVYAEGDAFEALDDAELEWLTL